MSAALKERDPLILRLAVLFPDSFIGGASGKTLGNVAIGGE